jgi:hypothetical protein
MLNELIIFLSWLLLFLYFPLYFDLCGNDLTCRYNAMFQTDSTNYLVRLVSFDMLLKKFQAA